VLSYRKQNLIMKSIFNGIIFLGMLTILSAAGLSDLGLISFGEICVKVLLGAFLMFSGYFLPQLIPVIKCLATKSARQKCKVQNLH